MIDATALLRAYARRRWAALGKLDVAQAQHAILRRLVDRARGTRFGRAHGFGEIRTIADFRARVPLQTYETLWRDWWRQDFPNLQGTTTPDPVPFLAESSGTTSGRTKYVPVTWAMVRANQRAARDVLAYHVRARPGSALFGGRNFVLGGSTALRSLAPGVQAGDLSAIAAVTMPALARLRAFPPRRLALIADWDEKLEAMAAAALGQDLRSIAGTPSWVLLLLERIAAAAGTSELNAVFPGLELFVHGGTGMAPYRSRFARWFASGRVDLREVYPASEGFIAAADCGPDGGLRVFADNGIFFEFVPLSELDQESPTRLDLSTVEPGIDYAIAVTTNAGLFACLIGDVVRFVSRDPPRLLITGRTAHTLSMFGEHLSGAELDAAVAASGAALDVPLGDYTVVARLEGVHGRHAFVVEAEHGDAAELALRIDQALQDANADYTAHRARNVQLMPPVVTLVPPGTFARWMRRRGKLGGQNKVPRVIQEDDLATLLEEAKTLNA